jgi:hypothetical protein
MPVIFENDINAAIEGDCYFHGITEIQCVIGKRRGGDCKKLILNANRYS